MNKNKGFTLVELLAMMAVIAIISVVAIPNIMGVVANQRASIIKNDATILVDKAKNYLARNTKIKIPASPNCLLFSLNFLDDNQDLKTGPNSGEYDPYESFVIVAKVSQEYKYYVRLIENVNDTKIYGIDFRDSTTVNQKKNDFIKTSSDSGFEPIGMTGNKTSDINIIKNKYSVCSSIIESNYIG